MRLCVTAALAALLALPASAQSLGQLFGQSLRQAPKDQATAPGEGQGLGGLLNRLTKGGDAGAGAEGKRLQDTPMYKVFEKFPVADTSNPPDYPKTAISIGYPAWLDDPSAGMGRFKGKQCVNYAVTFWTAPGKSERYDNMVVCTTDLAKVSHDSLRTVWPFFGAGGQTSGQVRTEGPLPPAVPFPSDPKSQKFMQSGGVFMLGAILTGLGYDWNFAQDKRRVWVVRVGDLPAPSAQGAAASAASADAGNQAVASVCRADNFSTERYNRIVPGMSFDAVKNLMGCEPDPDLTQRSQRTVTYKWAATINNLVAAKSITVYFDPQGAKVKPLGKEYKYSNGF